MKLFVIIVICVLAFILVRLYFKNRLKYKTETITAYTGGLGSGKTFLSVCKVRSLYFWNNLKQKIRKLFKKEYREVNVYSNIPIYVNKKYGYSKILTKEHLLLQEKLEGLPILLIDEIGSFASQFEYKNKNVIITFDEFVRFFRHYTKGGYIVCNDQCSENIVLVVRRRLNKIHNLSNFIKLGALVFYYERMINISEEIKTIDQVNDTATDTQNNMQLKFKIVFGIKKYYDTFCYNGRYSGLVNKKGLHHKKLKTNNVLTCPNDKLDAFFESKTLKE